MDPKSITLPLGYIPFAPNNGIEPLAKRFSVFRSTTELVRRKIMKKFKQCERTGIWTQDQRLKRPLLYRWAMHPVQFKFTQYGTWTHFDAVKGHYPNL